MSVNECSDSQKKQISNFRKLLLERIDKANPRRDLTDENTKLLAKLKAIANKLKHR